jgi:carbon storage regulator CsrA
MLVLSRRQNEKVLFPALDIIVEVVGFNRNTVRLGIDAPSSVAIVREELAKDAKTAAKPAAAKDRHRLRNQLHSATLAVHLAQKQLQAGRSEEAARTLNEALQHFTELENALPAPAAAPAKPIRALVVEDNHNESTLLAEYLRLNGIKVETAHDGAEALEHLRSQGRPDVILLDMRMPRCDGPATIAAIRGNADFEGMKVFAVSGADPEECAVPTGACGVDGWFTKPLNPVKLLDEMKLALHRN